MNDVIVFVIGPSKAGKTATKLFLTANPAACGVERRIVRVDLDEVLGEANRGNTERAIQVCENIFDTPDAITLIDVGAGQLISEDFRRYLRTSGALIVVVDCGRATFCERHRENAANEVGRYYGDGSLERLWLEAARENRVVNSNGAYAPEPWARQLATIICAH